MDVLFLVAVDLGGNVISFSVILRNSLILLVASGKQVSSSGRIE